MCLCKFAFYSREIISGLRATVTKGHNVGMFSETIQERPMNLCGFITTLEFYTRKVACFARPIFKVTKSRYLNALSALKFIAFTFTYSITARVVGTLQMTLQPVFSIFPLLSWTWRELQACPFPNVVFPPLPLSALSSSPFHCASVLARPDERETSPYHFSLRLFTMVSRSSRAS